MAYDTQAYEDQHGTPVVVMVVTGTHDVSRLVGLLDKGLCEHMPIRDHITRQLRRRNVGRAALRLLAQHGGPDLLERVPSTPDDALLTGAEADALAEGSIVRWYRDRTEAGNRTKGPDGWQPALAVSSRRQYVLIHDAAIAEASA